MSSCAAPRGRLAHPRRAANHHAFCLSDACTAPPHALAGAAHLRMHTNGDGTPVAAATLAQSAVAGAVV